MPPSDRLRVLIAPDCLGDSLTPVQAAVFGPQKGAEPEPCPVLVQADRITVEVAALRDAGIAAAYTVADHAGSVQLAIDDAANQLAGLADVTAAELGNSGTTRYR